MLSRPSAGSAPSLLKPFVCTRCLRRAAAAHTSSSATAAATASPPSTRNNRIRTFATTTTAPTATTNPPPAAAAAPLPTRRLIALSGPDAPKFLQGLTTNNVAPAQRTGWYTAFLNAQGRVLHDAFVYPTAAANAASVTTSGPATVATGAATDADWACFIEVDGAGADALARVLRRHRLRSKVRLRVVDEGEWAVWAAWLPPAADGDAGLAATLEGLRAGGDGGAGVVHLPDARAPGFGHRVLVPGGGGLPAPLERLERVGVREYTVRRYLYGVPEGPREMRAEEALPLESNVDLMRGVDFRKGCYVGQELTIRTKHTGVVRKRILPVRLYDLDGPEPERLEFVEDGTAEGLPAEAADIKKVAGGEGEGGEGGVGRRRNANRSAGKWLAGAGNIGLALCRLEMMTDVKVAAEGMGAGGGGYTPGMRFGLKWTVDGEEQGERSIGIKAFVPEWHHLRAEEDARGRKNKTQQVVE